MLINGICSGRRHGSSHVHGIFDSVVGHFAGGNAGELQVPEHAENHNGGKQRDDTVHAAAQPQEAADTA